MPNDDVTPDDSLPDALKDALSDKSMLGTYQGEPVLKTTIKLVRAGDGLSKAMKIEPELLPVGSKGMLLVEYEVDQHAHKRITDTDAFELVQTLVALTVTPVDDKSSQRKIERQRRKLDEQRMREQNVRSLKEADPEFNPDGDLDAADAAALAAGEGDEDGSE